MKRLSSIVIILVLLLTIFAGCQSSDDLLRKESLSKETQDVVDTAIIRDCGGREISWDFPGYYYGTINNCIIVNDINPESMHLTVACKISVGDYAFEWGFPIKLYAFKDGEACTLGEAYSRGWLNDEHIQQIYEHHEDFRTNYNEYFGKWFESQQ